MKTKKGGYLILKIQLLNGRLFNHYLSMDNEAIYNAEQGKILSALWDEKPLTGSELTYVTGLAKSSLSLALKGLDKKGLILSYPSEKDKRIRYYDLTKLGSSQQAVGDKISKNLSDTFYNDFSNEEIEQFESYLERVLSNLESKFER